MAKILIIDDDALVRKSFSRFFVDEGHEVLCAGNLSEGRKSADQGVDVIYLDLQLPDGEGLRAIDDLAAAPGRPEVIVITGMGSGYGAKQSVESNAWDYITKPASPQVLMNSLESALQYRQQSRQTRTPTADFDRCGMIGDSPAMRRTIQEIGKAAMSKASVLLRGETGVGKELAAHTIHRNSERNQGAFVVVDCSSLTESLIESTLYGHVKGAFTDARSDRLGLVAEADGGTLFLDEIGELPLTLQKSFLRVLQEHHFRPVGSSREQTSDFRLVGATNRDLEKMAQQGTFRSDLLFRIRTMEIVLPSLREREKDIETLAFHLIRQSCDRYGLETKSASQELLRVTASYSWPGNVREMKNVMEAAVIQAGDDPILYPKHLPGHVRLALIGAKGPSAAIVDEQSPLADRNSAHVTDNEDFSQRSKQIPKFSEYKSERDREYFQMLMQVADRDVPLASRLSGLSVPSVYRYLAITGIPSRKSPGIN